MSKLTRRAFLGGTAAIPLSLWLPGCNGGGGGNGSNGVEGEGPTGPTGTGPSPGALVRHDARSPEGQAMLEIYAQAVNQMKTAIAEGDPLGWVFQWYTHAVRNDRTKAGEIARIYPTASPDRDLANDMWNTCRAHFGPPEDDFLPWHRMYVFFFEQIIRQVSGNDEFTLPYWDYSVADPALHGVIPPEFRQDGDPTFGSLFVGKRNSGVNAGQAIDQGEPGNPLSTSALGECGYSQQGVIPGFNRRLDFGLHGNIHVLTGDSQNMGSVPWAAGDPIFWMHHCNIDRLWASWNAAGRVNPSTAAWLDQEFVFADRDGNRVVGKTADFTSIAPLGYTYDRLEPVPPCPPAPAPMDDVPVVVQPRTAARAQPISLTAGAVRATLAPPPAELDEQPAPPLGDQVRALEDKRLYLVARGLATDAQPGVLYHVYLGLPDGTNPAAGGEHLVGTLNFFGFGAHGDDMSHDAYYSFDVTDLAKQLEADGRLGGSPSLTIAPVGTPASEAQPVVGEVTLVEQ